MVHKTSEQYVCTVCGYNMAGYYPSHCPFCGAPRTRFLTWQQCAARHHVEATPVSDKVTRLNSVPRLGVEHATYRIQSGPRVYWIDCPSAFDRRLPAADIILFTHHHFLGASNQYRRLFSAQAWIHQQDSRHDLCKAFTFDHTFHQNFTEDGIEAWHIGGHTPGFTIYIFEDNLFVCDYVFLIREGMTFNPYGPAGETLAGGQRLRRILEHRQIAKVCGVNYVIDYQEWLAKFDQGPLYGGY